MGKFFFDFSDGEFKFALSDDVAADFDGSMMTRLGRNLAMDMESGDVHVISDFPDGEVLDSDSLDGFDDYEY